VIKSDVAFRFKESLPSTLSQGVKDVFGNEKITVAGESRPSSGT